MVKKFEKMCEPFQIRHVRLKNRMVCPAHTRLYANKDGHVSDVMVASYEALAKGGVGMIVIEGATVDYPLGVGTGPRHLLTENKFIPALSKLPEAVRKHNCACFLQLTHAGPSHSPKVFGKTPVASSSLELDDRPIPSNTKDQALNFDEIKDLVDKFATAAERAKKAGFEGVEVHGAHRYLINSFLSPAWNVRQDEYGPQNPENRTRFLVEIIKAIRERVGADYPVGVRINGQEWGHPRAITVEDSRETAKLLEQAGIDYISVSGFGYGRYVWINYPEQILYPEPRKEFASLVKQINKPGILIPSAQAIKEVVSVPVIGAGGLYPELGEWILQQGKVDLIGMVRRLIADPEIPNKVAAGRLDDIVPCMSCCECTGKLTDKEPVRCRVNPALGRELEHVIKPADKKKRVMVVGAGPGGMEAARVAALRGHNVTIFDKEPKLGGLMPLAAFVKGCEIEDIPGHIRYYRNQLNKLGVNLRLGQEVTPEVIEQEKPDVLIIATGGIPAVPDIAGIEQHRVLSGGELHSRVKPLLRFFGPTLLRRLTRLWMPVGNKVVILGGQIAGCQLAEFLVKRGRKVTVAETGEKLGDGIPERNRPRILSWLDERGVSMLGGVKYKRVSDQGLTITTKEGEEKTLGADTIIVAVPFKPNSELCQAIESKVPEIHKVGDCAEPRKIIEAISDGMRVGCTI